MYHQNYTKEAGSAGYKRYLAQIGLTTPTTPKAMNPEKSSSLADAVQLQRRRRAGLLPVRLRPA
jgi:hypothetical protein